MGAPSNKTTKKSERQALAVKRSKETKTTVATASTRTSTVIGGAQKQKKITSKVDLDVSVEPSQTSRYDTYTVHVSCH